MRDEVGETLALNKELVSVSYEEASQMLKEFIEGKPACSQALRHLKKGTEIQLLYDDKHDFAIFYDGQSARVEARQASKPDVEFLIHSEGLRAIAKNPGTDLGQLGIEVVRQIVAGQVKVRVVGPVLNVLTKGYLKIIQEAGPEFTAFLASKGLKGLSKLKSVIKSLKA